MRYSNYFSQLVRSMPEHSRIISLLVESHGLAYLLGTLARSDHTSSEYLSTLQQFQSVTEKLCIQLSVLPSSSNYQKKA